MVETPSVELEQLLGIITHKMLEPLLVLDLLRRHAHDDSVVPIEPHLVKTLIEAKLTKFSSRKGTQSQSSRASALRISRATATDRWRDLSARSTVRAARDSNAARPCENPGPRSEVAA